MGLSFDPKDLLPDGALDPGSSVLGGTPSTENLSRTVLMQRSFAEAMFALGAITCIIFLLIYITKLGAAGDNAKARKNAITGIIVSGIALVLLGGLSVVLAFAWGFLGGV